MPREQKISLPFWNAWSENEYKLILTQWDNDWHNENSKIGHVMYFEGLGGLVSCLSESSEQENFNVA